MLVRKTAASAPDGSDDNFRASLVPYEIAIVTSTSIVQIAE